jgi:hypothetical protein
MRRPKYPANKSGPDDREGIQDILADDIGLVDEDGPIGLVGVRKYLPVEIHTRVVP